MSAGHCPQPEGYGGGPGSGGVRRFRFCSKWVLVGGGGEEAEVRESAAPAAFEVWTRWGCAARGLSRDAAWAWAERAVSPGRADPGAPGLRLVSDAGG